MWHSGDGAVGHGLNRQGLRHKAVEQFAAMRREPPIESEGVLVEVVRQVLGGHVALMGAEQPALDERIDQMNVWQ